MNTPPQEPMPNHVVLRYRQLITDHWKWFLIVPVFVGIILGFLLASTTAITGHDYTDPILHTLIRAAKVLIIVADVGVFYVAATVAWASYKHPESPTLPEATQRVRSLAMMIGALLLLVASQLLLFHTH